MPPPLVEVNDLHVRYGRREVLRGASFVAFAGQLVAIHGENGSGKSTLLSILAGARRPDRGVSRVRGAVGYCPQRCVVFPHLTPDEHLRLFGKAYGLSSDAVRARADELFEKLACIRDRSRMLVELSGGTQQKVNLAIALLRDPPILLLDEPYAGFDVETYRRFSEYADDARARGTCILLVTHIALEPERYDVLMHLRDGALHVDHA